MEETQLDRHDGTIAVGVALIQLNRAVEVNYHPRLSDLCRRDQDVRAEMG